MTGQEDRFWLVWCVSCLWRVSPLMPIDRGYLSINIISGEEVAIKPFVTNCSFGNLRVAVLP